MENTQHKKGICSILNLHIKKGNFSRPDFENIIFISDYTKLYISFFCKTYICFFLAVKKDKKTKNNAGKFKVLSPNFQNTKRGIKICIN